MMNSEYLKKQQKYTRKLMKATDKAKYYDSLVSSSPLNDKIHDKRRKYHHKKVKYQRKLDALKLSLQPDTLIDSPPYFHTVLRVTQYAWSLEKTKGKEDPELAAKNAKKQTLKIVQRTHQETALFHSCVTKSVLTKRPSNDIIMVKMHTNKDSITQNHRCKNCPAVKKVGACRCESKQRHAG
ncbi:hypothetical protein [uncultured Shewanella sp.]|uniref:hypothetical protein n=1 Tax=uncultured Shewanella sp. TaxID=173975 RepID=UPI00260A7672|nr:hypothetical protein [uncultured Shewanella sp.]